MICSAACRRAAFLTSSPSHLLEIPAGSLRSLACSILPLNPSTYGKDSCSLVAPVSSKDPTFHSGRSYNRSPPIKSSSFDSAIRFSSTMEQWYIQHTFYSNPPILLFFLRCPCVHLTKGFETDGPFIEIEINRQTRPLFSCPGMENLGFLLLLNSNVILIFLFFFLAR